MKSEYLLKHLSKVDLSFTKITNNDVIEVIKKIDTPPKFIEDWSKDIAELETFFSNIETPEQSIKLNANTCISNIYVFIENHLMITKANNGKLFFLPYLHRLKELKEVLKSR